MRKILVVIAVVVLLGAAYIGSIALSVRDLIDAARSGNTAEVAARTDFVRLRRSISDQILDAYLDKNGRNRKPLERMLIDTYGTSVADAMLSKFLTPENLSSLLQTGTVADASQAAVWQVPSLATIDPERLWDLVSRVRPVQIKQVELRISASDAPEVYSAVGLRLDGTTWKISGLRLPKKVVEKLASSLPAR
jgi:hypothetical protein